jgi:hypothetical protein
MTLFDFIRGAFRVLGLLGCAVVLMTVVYGLAGLVVMIVQPRGRR